MRLFLILVFCFVMALPAVFAQQEAGGFGGLANTTIMTKQLEHADAEEVVSILNNLFPIKFSADSKTNTIYARATQAQIEEATEVIQEMEQATLKANQGKGKNRRSTSGLSALGGGRPIKGGTGLTAIIGGERPPKAPKPPLPIPSKIDLERSLVPLAVELSNVVKEFGAEHPKTKVLREQIDTMRSEFEKAANEFAERGVSIGRDLAPLVKELVQLEVEYGPNHPDTRRQREKLEATLRRLRGLEFKFGRQSRSRRSAKFAQQHTELDTEVSQLIERLRDDESAQLPKEQVEKIESELAETVGELFDVRQKAEEADWEQANEQLQKIRKRLDERKQNREEIVQSRVKELLNESE